MSDKSLMMHLKFPTTAKRDTTLNNIIKSLVSEASLYHVMNEVAPTFLVQMFRFNIWLRREFYSIRELKFEVLLKILTTVLL